MTKILIDRFNNEPIYFNKNLGKFYCEYAGHTYEDTSLGDLKQILKKLTIKPESGFCFIIAYNGIKKAEMTRSWFNDYLGEETVLIREVDGSRYEDRKSRKELWPYTKENIKVYEEAEKLREEGWSMIHKAEKYASRLKK